MFDVCDESEQQTVRHKDVFQVSGVAAFLKLLPDDITASHSSAAACRQTGLVLELRPHSGQHQTATGRVSCVRTEHALTTGIRLFKT